MRSDAGVPDVAQGYFVTGTDTGVGKTLAAAALLCAFTARGRRAAGMKPVAAGAERTAAGLRNADALTLQRGSSVELPYDLVNPYCFEPPIAPHLAAAESGTSIDLEVLVHCYGQIAAQAEVVVVEGAGGWLVPLDAALTFAAVPARLSLGVVLVVGLRLGCINHALLTAEAIGHHGCRSVAWIGSVLDPGMLRLERNVETLRDRLPMPCLGVIPRLASPAPATAARWLDLAPLALEG